MAEELKLPKNEAPEVKISYEDIQLPTQPEPLMDDQFGLIPTISQTPTFKPRKMIEQLRIQNGTVWVYDQANDSWFQLGSDTVYGGKVVSGASSTPFPSGWSVSNPSTGNYQITHNLGHTSYSVTITPLQVAIPNITDHSSNTFSVNFRNSSFTDADSNFFFILTDES